MKPILLNKFFEITSSNGGNESQQVAIENILTPNETPYCSKKNGNIIVHLKYKGKSEEFTLSNFAVRGGEQCSCPLKDALLFVSSNPLSDQDVEKYYDFTEDQFKKLEKKSETEPILFISCDDSTREFESQVWKTGKYVSLLFINTLEETEGTNIDVQHIGLVGFDGKQDSFDCPTIDTSLKVTYPSYDDFNELLDIFNDEFDAYPSLIIFSKDEKQLKTVEEVAKKYSEKDEEMNFFHSSKTIHVHGEHCHHGHEEEASASQLSVFISEFFSITKLPFVVYVTPNLEKRVKFNGEITKENLIQFVEDCKAGKLSNFMRTGARLEGDKHPRLPGLYHVVQSSFDELVTKPSGDFLLLAHASYQFDPTLFFVLADVLKDVKSFKIGVFDVSENDMDIKVTSSPVCFFFGQDKSKPITIKKDKFNAKLLDFLGDNLQEKIDVSSKKKLFDERSKLFQLIIESRQFIHHIKGAFQIVKDQVSKEEAENIQKNVSILDEILNQDPSVIDFEKLNNQSEVLKKETKNLFALAKKAELKNVIPIHDEEEYETETEKAKDKLIVIDWTASWCGPCKFIAPFFAEMSEKYQNVAFFKIDVDECADLAQKAKIMSMPTFHFHKGGKLIDQFSGANPDGLKQAIEKNQ